jgi:hypothetical protein
MKERQESPYTSRKQSNGFTLSCREQRQIAKNQRKLGVLDTELRRNMENLQRQF